MIHHETAKTGDLLRDMENAMPGFSKGQKRIAQYLLEHYHKAAYMTASALGNVVGVSESTVVRFAIELGFEGYPQMQAAMQETIRVRMTTVQRMEAVNDRFREGEILDTVLNADAEKIRANLSRMTPKDLSDPQHVAAVLGYDDLDEDSVMTPLGLRTLSRVSVVRDGVAEKIVDEYGSLQELMDDISEDPERLGDFGVNNPAILADSLYRMKGTKQGNA